MTEMVKISPEGLEVAVAYLENKQNTQATAESLGMPVEVVQVLLDKPETKRYLDRIYFESGFRNRSRMADLMDEIINQKLQEMEDTGVGSSADILDILKAAHAMKIKEMEMQVKLIEAENKGPSVQVNTQINTNVSGGANYNQLLDRLLKGNG